MTTTEDVAEAVTGLDNDTLTMMLETVRDYVRDAIPAERLLKLDHEDEFFILAFNGAGPASVDGARSRRQLAPAPQGR